MQGAQRGPSVSFLPAGASARKARRLRLSRWLRLECSVGVFIHGPRCLKLAAGWTSAGLLARAPRVALHTASPHGLPLGAVAGLQKHLRRAGPSPRHRDGRSSLRNPTARLRPRPPHQSGPSPRSAGFRGTGRGSAWEQRGAHVVRCERSDVPGRYKVLPLALWKDQHNRLNSPPPSPACLFTPRPKIGGGI